MKKTLLLSLLMLGSIFLTGCVASTASTVNTVIDTLNDRRTTGEMVDDKAITLKLLGWSVAEPEIYGAHLNFMVFNQIVLVTGEAPNENLRSHIVRQLPLIVPEIKQVINELVVAPNSNYLSRIKDAAISTQIKLIFHDQEVFHPAHVNVITENQVVFLMGEVTQREAKKAGSIAAKAKGVRKVVKLFEYLESRPADEIERDRQYEIEAKKAELEEARRNERENKKAKLKEQLRVLGVNTEGTYF